MSSANRNKLRVSKDKIRQAAKRDELEDGVFCFVTSQPTKGVLKTGDYAGTLTLNAICTALKDPNDPTSGVRPTMRGGALLPFDNPDWEGHEAESWTWGLTAQWLYALYDEKELVRRPRWFDGKLYYKGKEIKAADEQKYVEESLDALQEKALDLLDNPKDMGNRMFYGRVGKRKPADRFKNIVDAWSELPEGVTLTPIKDRDGKSSGSSTAAPSRRKKKTSRRGRK